MMCISRQAPPKKRWSGAAVERCSAQKIPEDGLAWRWAIKNGGRRRAFLTDQYGKPGRRARLGGDKGCPCRWIYGYDRVSLVCKCGPAATNHAWDGVKLYLMMISAKSRRWLVCRDESVAAQGQEKQQQERGVLPEPLHTDDSTTAMEAENVTGCKVDRNEWNLTTFLILRLWAGCPGWTCF